MIYLSINIEGYIMEIVYIVIGVVIGVGLGLFLDVGSLANIFAKKEEEIDDKIEHPDKGK